MADVSQLIAKPHVVLEPTALGISVSVRNAPHLAHLQRIIADPFAAIAHAQRIYLDSQIPMVMLPIPLGQLGAKT